MVQLLNGQVALPTLGTHARIEFDLPLKALHSTDHIHEVSFTLKYREVCNEKFVINQLSDLNFIQPFNTAQFILANKPNNRYGPHGYDDSVYLTSLFAAEYCCVSY